MRSRALIAGVIASLAVVSGVTSATAATKAADKAIAKAGLLTIDDFPPGWTAARRTSSGDTDIGAGGKTCTALKKRADAAKKLRTAHGVSADFKQSSTTQISNSASVYRTVPGVERALGVLTDPSVVPCLQKTLDNVLAKSASKGVRYAVSLAPLSAPPVGDATAGYEFTITARQGGDSFQLYIDMQLVQVGRTGLTFSFEGESPSPALLHQDLVQKVVARVGAAEAATS